MYMLTRPGTVGLLGSSDGNSLLTSATALLGGYAPQHYWDFVNNRALFNQVDVGAITGTPNLSQGRTGTSNQVAYAETTSGTLTSFPINTMRRTNKGLLVEQARTNLILRSQEFDDAAWTKTDITVSANATSAPDTTTTADQLTEGTAGTAAVRNASALTITAASTYVVSCYVKYVNQPWIRLIVADTTTATNGYQAWFNVQTGTVGTASNIGVGWTVGTATIRSLANGWYRISLSGVVAGTAMYAFLNSASADASATRVNNSVYHLWGAQSEVVTATMTKPSSYIPTTTVANNRGSDVMHVTTGLSIAAPYTLYAKFKRDANQAATSLLLQVDDASSNNRSFVATTSASNGNAGTISAGVSQYSTSVGTVTDDVTAKLASRFITNDFIACINGTLSAADTSGTVPAAPTGLRFGSSAAGGSSANAYIETLAFFDTGLSNAALQAMTT